VTSSRLTVSLHIVHFQLHRTLMSATALFVIAAMVAIFVEKKGFQQVPVNSVEYNNTSYTFISPVLML